MQQRFRMKMIHIYLQLVLVASVFCVGSSHLSLKPKYHVEIINRLSGGNVLSVHCKSKNDDLGLQRVPAQGGKYGFAFHFDFFGTTLFFCSLSYLDYHVEFDAIDAFLLKNCGGGTWCIWQAQDDGIYLMDTKSSTCVFRYKWGTR